MAYFLFRSFMRFLALWPLPLLRALGWGLGSVLYYAGKHRRNILLRNVALCLPQLDAQARRRFMREHIRLWAQAALDRAWLYHGNMRCLHKRLRLSGDIAGFDRSGNVVVLNPHFLGMEAAAICLLQRFPHRKMVAIYTPLRGAWLDRWAYAGRTRFAHGRVFSRYDDIRHVVRALRAGERVLLLPDMDFGAAQSVFVPFFGVPAATLTALAKYAQMGAAQVVMLTAKLDAKGYQVHLSRQGWEPFPSGDALQDARHMNAQLERAILTMPEQYYWLHRRFKTRPPGQPSVYA